MNVSDYPEAKPILFSTEMVRAILAGSKTQTRQVIKHQPPADIPPKHNICCMPGIWKNGRFRSLWYMDVIQQYPFKQTRYWEEIAPHQKGDILYVRETWGNYSYDDPESNAVYDLYKADYPDGARTYEWPDPDEFGDKIICDLPKWRPSIHMPREVARLFIKVTGVRVERVQEITPANVVAEGAYPDCEDCIENYYGNGSQCDYKGDDECSQCESVIEAFKELWEGLNAKRGFGWDKNPWVWVYEFEVLKNGN